MSPALVAWRWTVIASYGASSRVSRLGTDQTVARTVAWARIVTCACSAQPDKKRKSSLALQRRALENGRKVSSTRVVRVIIILEAHRIAPSLGAGRMART